MPPFVGGDFSSVLPLTPHTRLVPEAQRKFLNHISLNIADDKAQDSPFWTHLMKSPHRRRKSSVTPWRK